MLTGFGLAARVASLKMVAMSHVGTEMSANDGQCNGLHSCVCLVCSLCIRQFSSCWSVQEVILSITGLFVVVVAFFG